MNVMPSASAGTSGFASKMYAARREERRCCVKCNEPLRLDLHVAKAKVCDACERAMKDPSLPREVKPRAKRISDEEHGLRVLRAKEIIRAMKKASLTCSDLAKLLGVRDWYVKNRLHGSNHFVSREAFSAWMEAIENAKDSSYLRERVDGRGIREARRSAHLSIELLAERMKVGASSLKTWENGKTKPTGANYELAIQICHEETRRIHEGRRI